MANQSFKFIFIRVLYVLVFINIGIHQALAEKTNNNKIYTVGFAQDTLENDWRRAQVNELTKQFKSPLDIKFIVTDAGGNSAKQIQDIEDLAHQKIDLIITSPRDGRANTPAISRVDKQGIPVVLITRVITSNDYTSIVSPKETAAVVLKILKGKKVAKKIRVASQIITKNNINSISPVF